MLFLIFVYSLEIAEDLLCICKVVLAYVPQSKGCYETFLLQRITLAYCHLKNFGATYEVLQTKQRKLPPNIHYKGLKKDLQVDPPKILKKLSTSELLPPKFVIETKVFAFKVERSLLFFVFITVILLKI